MGISYKYDCYKRGKTDVILSMNWLAEHKAIINTVLRTIKLSHGHEEIQLSIPITIPAKASERVYEAIVQEI
jgi:hypothetical protein